MIKTELKLEKEVKKEIKAALMELWPDCWHLMVVPAGWGARGAPDHIIAAPVVITQEMVGKTYGMFIGIEAKKDGAKMKAWKQVQQLVTAQIIKAGGFSMCVFGRKDIPDMVHRLKLYFHIK